MQMMKIQFIIFVVLPWTPLILAQYDFVFAPKSKTHPDAVKYCRGLHRNLIRINNWDKHTYVMNYAKENGLYNYWIDANDNWRENKFVYSDNRPVTFLPWKSGAPNGGRTENCVFTDADIPGYKYDDHNCSGIRNVICELNYYDLDFAPKSKTYEDAVKHCRGVKRNLIRINNWEKHNVVMYYAKESGLYNYWIDANDIKEENKFVDSDNKTVTFLPWKYGAPNGGRTENCVFTDADIPSYKYDDHICSGIRNVICEKAIFDFVYAPKSLPYDDAVKYCRALNRNLLRIEHWDKQNFAVYYAKENGLYNFWIDANDIKEENKFVDSDNKPVTFLNWKPGSPNGGRTENCVFTDGDIPGYQWEDHICSAIRNVICEKAA